MEMRVGTRVGVWYASGRVICEWEGGIRSRQVRIDVEMVEWLDGWTVGRSDAAGAHHDDGQVG